MRVLLYMLIRFKKKWKEAFIIGCTILIWYLLYLNNYVISDTLDNNFGIILLMNFFGLFYFYDKYFKNRK